MAISDDYLDFLLGELAVVGRVTARRMFGGAGLYCEGLFFALVAGEGLYFKVDDSNRADYERAGSRPFVPFPDEPDKVMHYWQVPVDVLEDPDLLRDWGRKALQVALVASHRRRPRTPRRPAKVPPPAVGTAAAGAKRQRSKQR